MGNHRSGQNPYDAYSRFLPRKKQSAQAARAIGYFDKLYEWYMARVEWEGMPKEIDRRYVEDALAWGGLVVFYFDPRLGEFVCLSATQTNALDMYGNPTEFLTNPRGAYSPVRLSIDDCVPIWGTNSRVGVIDNLMDFAERLGSIDTTLDIVVQGMRVTRVITCPEEQRHTYTQIMREQSDGTPVIFGYDSLDISAITALDLKIDPNILPRLRHEFNQVWRSAMTFMGITSVNEDKAERLVADEASGQDGQVLISRNSFIQPRKLAADEINRKFNLDVRPKWCFDPESIPDLLLTEEAGALNV